MKIKSAFSKRYIIFVIITSLFLVCTRIIFYYFQDELSGFFFMDLLMSNRDLNFKTNYDLMSNGVFHYYEENPLLDEKAIYLYFWYFIFYPFYILPYEISLYLWDLLRLSSAIYISLKIEKITSDNRELYFFFLFSAIGYFTDMYLNNTNWLIQLLLIESFYQFQRDKKVLSGILFSFAVFKVTLILFPLILIIIKKLKVKHLAYFIAPLIILCIPYLIFPEYFISMLSNWFEVSDTSTDLSLINIFLKLWRLVQPAHLLYVSFITLIIILNISNEKIKDRIALIIYIFVSIFWILIWVLILEFALFI
jgi:hypothetical protein